MYSNRHFPWYTVVTANLFIYLWNSFQFKVIYEGITDRTYLAVPFSSSKKYNVFQ